MELESTGSDRWLIRHRHLECLLGFPIGVLFYSELLPVIPMSLVPGINQVKLNADGGEKKMKMFSERYRL